MFLCLRSPFFFSLSSFRSYFSIDASTTCGWAGGGGVVVFGLCFLCGGVLSWCQLVFFFFGWLLGFGGWLVFVALDFGPRYSKIVI